MNSDNIKIAPFDNLLVYKKGYTPEFVLKVISDRKLGGLRIFSVLKEDRLEEIDFLKDYTFLENLDVTSSSSYFNFNIKKKLTNLRKLSINVEGNNEIDFSGQVKLEYLSINWRKKIKGLENCKKLLSLCLNEFKEHDLSKINSLRNLTDIQIKTSSIQSLNGLQELVDLQNLDIGNCRKLQTIRAINHLSKLKELCFSICPNIKDYGEVTDLPKLEILNLTDCGKVQSLKFIDRFSSLQKLLLLGNTVIVDGDLNPAKRIKYFGYKHYNHYNIKLENPYYEQIMKDNLTKIKKLFGK
jgi:internalin A